jgi:hypothetical protein
MVKDVLMVFVFLPKVAVTSIGQLPGVVLVPTFQVYDTLPWLSAVC